MKNFSYNSSMIYQKRIPKNESPLQYRTLHSRTQNFSLYQRSESPNQQFQKPSSTSPAQKIPKKTPPKQINDFVNRKFSTQTKKIPQRVTINSSRSPSRERRDPSLTVTKNNSALNIFSESTKQLEELQRNPTYRATKPELHKGIIDILSLIKKEKQVIMNDMKHITKQMQKYKKQYEEVEKELEEIKMENIRLKDQNDDTDQFNETYSKMVQVLNQMDIDYKCILPELQNVSLDTEYKSLDKEEVIRIQKSIIKRQVKIIEDSRLLNQMLLFKIKEL